MTDAQQRAAAKQFVKDWAGRGYEKGDSQPFWLALLNRVYGIENPDQFISFEDQIMLDHTSFIDGTIPSTHVLIEQKGIGKDLKKPIKQSDGTLLTPFQQAKRYAAELPYSQRPRWIVTCNFQEFHVYDMERPTGDPEVIYLKDLGDEYYRLQFLVEQGNAHTKKEMEISLQAGELVGKLYDALLKQYINPGDEELKSLNMLCVRLVFCLYAEDAGIFGSHNMFHDYLKGFQPKNIRKALLDLFKVLDTKVEDRDPYMDDDLAAFPYVNGGLFAEENIIIPKFTDEIIHLLLHNASEDFNWSSISPTIFGAVFESTLNPDTRRSGGMHYTSIENIHKVIDPLFYDALSAELEAIAAIPVEKTRMRRLDEFQDKIASLKFLDPACGSGNFLTETYISLRRLENKLLAIRHNDQIMMGFDHLSPIKVSIGQFYGIEINDFAVTVAKTALWIAESQMMKETEDIVHMNLDFLPLKSYANIVEGNALTTAWESVVPKHKLTYIMGNPPFVGQTFRSKNQADDVKKIFGDNPKAGKLDYVAAWYKLAAQYIEGTTIKAAFVSTNSISQGEQVAILWADLFKKHGVQIIFAHRTFNWTSEATEKAAVHCVIVGFCAFKCDPKFIFENGTRKQVSHINGYLVEGADVFIKGRGTPNDKSMPKMTQGNKPVDGGHLIFSETEYTAFIKAHPDKEHLFKRYNGSADFINNKVRYCLWLKDVSPAQYRSIPEITERLQHVADARNASPTPGFRAAAATPMLFTEIRQPEQTYLAIPEVSSQRRKYIPIGYLSPDVIASNTLYVLPNVNLYMFGVMTSNVHMAWMRTVCGRMKSDYRYSPAIYNNFPWPNPTEAQKRKIEQTAQAILDARTKYSDCTLADLYDELTMPPELLKAHQQNDKAVMQAYGFWGKLNTEAECVAELMKMYQGLTEGK